ncbi:uncharacterized protein LOC128222420 [Mya arenaria]|uniref:uncharacterized protein LOC128222420 n=1 Tax=Mya arenaria TaxID=6604 RepID=UPI0022DFAFCC|nr:uncharacterized protein LOC128222420 [Mya arenaria]
MADNSEYSEPLIPATQLLFDDDMTIPPAAGDLDLTQAPNIGTQTGPTESCIPGANNSGTSLPGIKASISGTGASGLVSMETHNTQSTEKEPQSQSIISGPVVSNTQKKGRTPRAPKSKQKSTVNASSAHQAQPTKPKSSKKRRRSEPEPPSPEPPGINIHNADENVSVVAAINNLAEQMRVSLDSLSSRIVKLETNLELTIKTHVQNAMSPVVNKLRKEFNEELNQVKSDMKSLPVNNAVPKESDQKKTTGLVLKNLPERRDENTVNSVNTLIKDGLKLEIKIKDAERKRANQSSECEIVVVSCNTKEDKHETMKCKATLKQNATYKNIYIEHDLTPEERNSIANLKTIAKVIGNDKLYVKGNRLVQRTHNEESRDAHEWQEVRHHRKTSPHQVRTRSGRSDHRRRDETFTRRHDTDRTSYRHEHQSSPDRHETRHRDHARDSSRRHQGYHDGEDRRNYTHGNQGYQGRHRNNYRQY